MTKSKFKIGFIIWFIFMNLIILVLAIFLWHFVVKIMNEGIEIFSFLILILFTLMLLIVFIIFKDFKYIIVNKTNKTIKWFSVYYPLGKIIELKNFIGLIKSTEYGSQGEYETIHLVDKSSKTSVKINGLFYTNFDEILNSIELKEIKKYNFGIWKYLKLIFTGRIRIEN